MRMNEWDREMERKRGELSERVRRKKEQSESQLIKMSAEVWKKKGERDEFHLERGDEAG